MFIKITPSTWQKGLQNMLRSDVDIALASFYCYCLRATKAVGEELQRSLVNLRRTAVKKSHFRLIIPLEPLPVPWEASEEERGRDADSPTEPSDVGRPPGPQRAPLHAGQVQHQPAAGRVRQGREPGLGGRRVRTGQALQNDGVLLTRRPVTTPIPPGRLLSGHQGP